MKKKLTAVLSAAALLVSASVVLAAEESSGKIQEVDMPSRSLTLEDGTRFRVIENVEIESFWPGQEVTVSYVIRSGQKIATGVMLEK